MGDQHEVDHRDAARVPAPTPVVEHPSPESFESPRPVPGLAVPQRIRRSGADPLGGGEVDGAAQRALASPSGGAGLETGVRARMESAFGADFGDVKVHTGPAASRLSADLQATAFTHGSDIYFSQGSYEPGSERGQHLLAHELTHVVQRKQGRDPGTPSASGAPRVGRADDPLETEAERVAGDVVGALRRQSRNDSCGQEHR